MRNTQGHSIRNQYSIMCTLDPYYTLFLSKYTVIKLSGLNYVLIVHKPGNKYSNCHTDLYVWCKIEGQRKTTKIMKTSGEKNSEPMTPFLGQKRLRSYGYVLGKEVKDTTSKMIPTGAMNGKKGRPMKRYLDNSREATKEYHITEEKANNTRNAIPGYDTRHV